MNPHSFLEPLKQVHVTRGRNGYEDVLASEADETFYRWEDETMRAKLMRLCPPRLWPKGAYDTCCPRPILVSEHHQSMLQEITDALTTSITDIVDRWWIDKDADLPGRMPLGEKEEELLKFVGLQSILGNMPDYAKCRGSWRPDFLVEEIKTEDGVAVENFRITEINARFSFNGFLFATYGQMALEESGMERHGITSATKPKEVVDGLFKFFRRDLPLHLLKGEEPGLDIHMFVEAVRLRFGTAPRIVNLADLRLVADPRSKSGFTLCAVFHKHEKNVTTPDVSSMFFTNEGELVEPIHQVGLELHQRELLAMRPEMLREISMRCFNDMRTILLVHDKRMLGIIKQELLKQEYLLIITKRQREILDKCIADTYLPRSTELEGLMFHSEAYPNFRHSYLLKPIRSGKGDGIVFGEDVTNEEWLAALKRQLSPDLQLEESCVIQRRIIPRLYDVVLKSSGERLRNPLIGTFMVANGTLLGLSIWRSSSDRICAVSHGGSWFCSVIRKDPGTETVGEAVSEACSA